MEVFGFHTVDENLFSPLDYSFTETYYDAQNIINILGWIPFCSSVTGVVRLVSTGGMWVSDDEFHRQNHKKYFTVSALRGGIEVLSLGWLFILPDLVVTASSNRRFKKLRKPKKLY